MFEAAKFEKIYSQTYYYNRLMNFDQFHIRFLFLTRYHLVLFLDPRDQIVQPASGRRHSLLSHDIGKISCTAQASFMWLRSFGFGQQCLHKITVSRLEDVKHQYVKTHEKMPFLFILKN